MQRSSHLVFTGNTGFGNGQPASGVQFCGRGVCAAVTGRLLLRRVAVQVRRAAETERHPGQGDGRDGRWQWHRTRLGDAIRRQRSMRGGVGHQQSMAGHISYTGQIIAILTSGELHCHLLRAQSQRFTRADLQRIV